MIDFEKENNRLYYLTCGALGRNYDGLFDTGDLSIASVETAEIIRGYFNLMLEDIEHRNNLIEELQRKIHALQKMNNMLIKENETLKTCSGSC